MIDWTSQTLVPWNHQMTNMKRLTIGTIQNIGSYAFSGASGITEISLGSTIRIIGNNAFAECINIQQITKSHKYNKECGCAQLMCIIAHSHTSAPKKEGNIVCRTQKRAT